MRISLLVPILPLLLLTSFACGDSGGSDAGTGGSAGATAGGTGGTNASGGSSSGGKGGSAGSSSGKGGSAGSPTSGGSSSTGGDPGDGGDGNGNGGAVGNPPTATINHPGDGEMRNVNDDIPFIGVATDPEDGDLTGASLVWTSSIEGEIGTGEMFDAALTQAGMHTITLTVTDSDGNEATDSVTLDLE